MKVEIYLTDDNNNMAQVVTY